MKIENSILIGTYKPIENVDFKIAEQCIEERFAFCKYQSYPFLADIRGVKSFTLEARNLLAKKGNELVTANAILVKSPVEKMMANVYISFNKPTKPTRLFTDKKKALVWLSRFIGNNDASIPNVSKVKSLLL